MVGQKKVLGQFERTPSDSVSIRVFECVHVSQLCVSGQCVHLDLQLCMCACYYIAAAIAVAAATIVATAASHAPTPTPPPSVVFPSVHPAPSTHPKLEGKKSDPVQSKAQVLRQNMVLCPF